ncbi:Zinc-dependent alcohol dehydrogenase [Chitinispirillum alkaliphilum]|nr:Zinc-dependent alcohol dehydrogenase [Chitinispirillum alkaliphilum]
MMQKAEKVISHNGEQNVPEFGDAAVCSAPGNFSVEQVRVGTPGENEVLVRVEGCGVCNSNLPLWEGREWFTYPMEPGSPGHEGWGTVEKCGKGADKFALGDRVTFLSSHAFSAFDIVHKDNIVALPSELDGQPFPGEPLGCAVNVVERADVGVNDTVAVVGTGFMGVLVARLCHLKGARVIAVSRRNSSLKIARQYGVDEAVKMEDYWNVIDQINKLTDGRGCSRVIEATGNQMYLDLASEIIATRGRLVIAGYHQDGLRSVNMQNWNWKGIDVINAHERDNSVYIKGIAKAVELVANGSIDLTPLLTHFYSMSSLNQAFEKMRQCPEGFIKAVVLI